MKEGKKEKKGKKEETKRGKKEKIRRFTYSVWIIFGDDWRCFELCFGDVR